MFSQVLTLVGREWKFEMREKVAVGGVMLFVIATVFVCYLSFRQIVHINTWNALFWIIILFTSFNAIGKSFTQEGESQQLYLYTLASPQAFILSKMIYNLLVMLFLTFLSFGIYVMFIGQAVLEEADMLQWLLAVLLGGTGFALNLTLISGIAAKTRQNIGMMAILGFPVILPFLVTLLRFSKNALDGLAWSVNLRYLLVLIAVDVIVAFLSYLLFPYLWRE